MKYRKKDIISFALTLPALAVVFLLLFFLKSEQLKIEDFLLIFYSFLFFYGILTLFFLAKRKFLGFNIFITTYFFYFFWSFYGFNLSDEGYSIGLALLKPENKDTFYYIIQAGYLIFEKWLSVLHNLLWARMFFVLFVSINVWLAFQIIKQFFDVEKNYYIIFLIFLVNLSFYRMFLNFIVPYDHFHHLTINLSLLLFFKFKDKKIPFHFALIGILLMFSVFSRFSFFVILFIFPFLMIWYEKNKWFSSFLFLLLGIGLGIWIFKILGGDLNNFLKYSVLTLKNQEVVGCCVFTSEDHKFATILEQYKSEIFAILIKSILFFWAYFISVLFKKDRFSKQSLVFFYVFLLSFSLFLLFPKAYRYENFEFLMSWIFGFYVIVLFDLFKQRDYGKLFLIIFLSAISFLSFFGSAVGIKKIFMSGSVLVLFPLIMLEFSRKDLVFVLIFLFSFLSITFTWNNHRIYQDERFDFLDTYFQIPPLKGIKTMRTKAEIIEDFYYQILPYKDSLSENYIVVGKGKIIPFLLDSQPKCFCWEVYDDKIIEKLKQKQVKYVIYFYKDPRRATWYLRRYEKFGANNHRKIYTFLKENAQIIFNEHNFILFYKIE